MAFPSVVLDSILRTASLATGGHIKTSSRAAKSHTLENTFGTLQNHAYNTTGTTDTTFLLGHDEDYALTTGAHNTSLGRDACKAVTSGSNNVGIGSRALEANATTNNCTAVGFQALSSCINAQNTAIGSMAGTNITNGDNNLCVGHQSGTNITTGQANTMIGALTNCALGNTNAMCIGYNAQTTTSNSIVLGNSDVTSLSIPGIQVGKSAGTILTYDGSKLVLASLDATPTDSSPHAVTSDGVFDALATKQNLLTFDNTPTLSSTNPVTSDGVFGALHAKQDLLTFDTSPVNGSNNVVTSDGIFDALELKQDTLTFDTSPVNGSNNVVTSDGIFDALELKQDTLTFDTSPTDGSNNVVTSNGVFDALASKQDTMAFGAYTLTQQSPHPQNITITHNVGYDVNIWTPIANVTPVNMTTNGTNINVTNEGDYHISLMMALNADDNAMHTWFLQIRVNGVVSGHGVLRESPTQNPGPISTYDFRTLWAFSTVHLQSTDNVTVRIYCKFEPTSAVAYLPTSTSPTNAVYHQLNIRQLA